MLIEKKLSNLQIYVLNSRFRMYYFCNQYAFFNTGKGNTNQSATAVTRGYKSNCHCECLKLAG